MFSPEQEKQIIDLHTDHFSDTYIAGKLGVKRILVKTFLEVYFQPKLKPIKVNKYDHLFNEPVAQGKMHKEYVKLDKSRKYGKG